MKRNPSALTETTFDIQASLVVNTAGPWIPTLNHKICRNTGSSKTVEGVINAFSKGAHIITRQLTQGHAIAISGRPGYRPA